MALVVLPGVVSFCRDAHVAGWIDAEARRSRHLLWLALYAACWFIWHLHEIRLFGNQGDTVLALNIHAVVSAVVFRYWAGHPTRLPAQPSAAWPQLSSKMGECPPKTASTRDRSDDRFSVQLPDRLP